MPASAYNFECKEASDRIALWSFRGCPNLAQWQQALDHGALWMRELESRGRRMGVVIDLTEQTNIGVEARRVAGQWRLAHMPLIANTILCASYVAPQAILRGAVTAAFWFARPVVPVSFKASRREAIEWSQREVVRLATIPPPA